METKQMITKPKSLRDVSMALAAATAAIESIELASVRNPPKLSYEQKIIAAVCGIDNGYPLKDFLTQEEVEDALRVLADVYTVTGVKMPEDWY